MQCRRGHENIDEAKFCAKCGVPLEEVSSKKIEPTVVAAAVMDSEVAVANLDAPEGKEKSHSGLIIVGASLLAVLVLLVVVITAGQHSPRKQVVTTTTSQPATTTTVVQVNNSGTFPPSTTVPTTGLVSESLTLWTCSTTLGISEAPAHLTTPVQVMVPAGTSAGQLAVYTDNQGLMELLAPAGWDCQATIGADGTSSILIYPPNQGAVTSSALPSGSTLEEVRGDQTSASTFQAAEQACQFFTAANKALDGNTCNMLSPAAEEAVNDTPNIVEFTDSPSVAGDGNPSGGMYTASGAMTYYPNSESGSWTETCTLAPSVSSLCSAIVSSFINSYGSN